MDKIDYTLYRQAFYAEPPAHVNIDWSIYFDKMCVDGVYLVITNFSSN